MKSDSTIVSVPSVADAPARMVNLSRVLLSSNQNLPER